MPFYEYECPSCRYYLEVLQKISDKPVKKCPSCGKSGLKRLVSAPVFRLKGSGWYETDFKSDKDAQRNLAMGEAVEPKAAAAEAKPGADDKAVKPEAATAVPDKSKPASTPAESPAQKPSKPAAAPARSLSAKRAAKRPVARPTRKPPRRATRGSRRR